MSDAKKLLPSILTYRPKWYLRAGLVELIRTADKACATAIEKSRAFDRIANELHAEGHTATADALRTSVTRFQAGSTCVIDNIRMVVHKASKKQLRSFVEVLTQHTTHLKNVSPGNDWETSPAREIALRKEIGDKVRNVDRMKTELTVNMLRKMGMLTVHDTEPIVDFAMIIKDWSELTNSPRIHSFAGLSEHLHTLTKLDIRMRELKTLLKELH